jgi:glycosyltransferase involved in cell wall biosynthesis
VKLAYLANYQGQLLLSRRRLIRNRALAGSFKIESVADLLNGRGCDVTIYSLGGVAERSGRWYGKFSEVLRPSGVEVHYQVEWDIPILGRAIGALSLIASVLAKHRRQPFDALILYNLGLPEAFAASVLSRLIGCPVVLEYEDDAFQGPSGARSWRQFPHMLGMHIVRSRIKAVVGVSPELIDQIGCQFKYLLRGTLREDLRRITPHEMSEESRLQFLYSGSIQPSKGVGELCAAWEEAGLANAELSIVGEGPGLSELRERYRGNVSITFHGFVPRSKLVDMFQSAHVMINPHRDCRDIGAVFPFKLIEYLGTGRPVISTKMAVLEAPLDVGILYSTRDTSSALAETLKVMRRDYSVWRLRAAESRDTVWKAYGPSAVGASLEALLVNVCALRRTSL